MRKRTAIFLIVTVAVVSGFGCAMIAGKEDAAVQASVEQRIRLQYVESLRNQASLRGESFRETDYAANPATSLQRPNGVYADNFRVYVTDTYTSLSTSPSITSPRVIIFDRGDRSMKVLDLHALPTGLLPALPSEGRLLAPTGIAVDGANVVFVSDSQQGTVFGYDRTGTLVITLGKKGDLAFPAGIAVDKQRNRLYVADSHAHLVKVYTTMGDRVYSTMEHRLLEIGPGTSPRDFKSPIAVALDRTGNIHVLDGKSKRVNVYDPDGNFIRGFSLTAGPSAVSLRPKGIAVDSDGHVYVSDGANNTVLIFDHGGRFITSWGKTGSLIGDFWTPLGIFIDDRDYVYIADQTNSRIQVYQYVK